MIYLRVNPAAARVTPNCAGVGLNSKKYRRTVWSCGLPQPAFADPAKVGETHLRGARPPPHEENELTDAPTGRPVPTAME